MNIYKFLELGKKYNDCPNCGNNFIGNGEGKLIVENDTFYRSCKCGFEVTVKENE
ncbi:DUF3797 domain-containing protein [Cytobacillus firmus]|uniref:DUF3797 domain-containing protein n=1 Tax=Cytobacillus firmus TaxID=1399 RepID=UPI00237ADEA8|nr:DUF3797 domain-containing protein [Cytobacillus firmus]MDD9312663.1 DUF3797 domain-containing protein [Cytobacillus firmus]